MRKIVFATNNRHKLDEVRDIPGNTWNIVIFRRYMKKCLLLILFCYCFSLSGQEVRTLNLTPAKWIWYPSGRVLQNTFVLFRKEFDLSKQPEKAIGWMLADSRYQLFVNGQRVQWGPAPSDPRWTEADPVDIAGYLKPGKNVIACQVLFYGFGEGTWPMGKPGFLFKLELDDQEIVSDRSWQTYLAQNWKPGQYKRSFLRALQENFDARKFPYGWNAETFNADSNWLPALESGASASEPSICAGFGEYQWEIFGDANLSEIRERSIPLMIENDVKINRLVEAAWLDWKRPPEEYFDVMTPDAFTSEWTKQIKETASGTWLVPEKNGKAAVMTFDFKEQSVGWPYFTIEAPEGTVVEMLVHEAHQFGGPVLINSHFNSWSRFICKEGVNHFETFDFESLRWLQLHIHNYSGNVKISDVGMRRRQYPFPVVPQIALSDTALQRLMNAAVNTLYNSAQETVVDGMARERQQYSGDGAHQLHAIYQVFGEFRLPARFIKTFSQGISLDGYFLDSWPAFDRLARIMERQMQLTGWGPILDHGVGFCFDNYYYYQYTGDTIGLQESFPRLLRFMDYLKSIQREDGLLPVENIGVPSVWIDHDAYHQQRHKQCAFNLYASAACLHALVPLCKAFNQYEEAEKIEQFGKELQLACIHKFWSLKEQTFVNNLPWLNEEKEPRYCDRSLSTAILFNQCPEGNNKRSVELLADCPKELGISYPCNAVWRYWALIASGRMDVVLNDLRVRWASMPSVLQNNTIQEPWNIEPDSNSQWSHCAVAPLIVLYQGIAGIRPTSPGYETIEIRPQLGDLENVNLTFQTVKGPILFKSNGKKGKREIEVQIPTGTQAQLILEGRIQLIKGGEISRIRSNISRKYASSNLLPFFLTSNLKIQR